jgi:ferric-dicitrate binding protein FerR (iron transport regulator)
MSDYLFDKAGDADPEIERLEELLAPLAYRGVAPELPRRRRARPFYVAAALTAVAAALVAVIIAHPWRPRLPSWAVTVQDGVAARLTVGEWLDTGAARARLVVADLGSVELSPHTRARIVATDATRHEMELERGTLAAVIHASPRRFVVKTPRALVTDLGCAFELTVDEAGRGRLVVTEGQVAVASDGAPEVVVPAGAHLELAEPAPPAPTTPTTPTPAKAPTPVPSAPPTTPAKHHATKTVHATKTIHTTRPAVTTPKKTQPHAAPAQKSEPTKMEHDPLKALKNSVE